jgi:4-amino-4-deoxy-L-arabinose transferase-like glycosyltransferase
MIRLSVPAATRSSLVPVVVAVLLAGATRAAYLLSSRMQFNADEAVTGLMAREILDGHQYVFYAGQDYGGSLEQYLEAGLYAALPLPENPFTLRLPLVLLCMATCALTYAVAARLFDDPVRPVLAAVLYAVGPWFNIVGSVTSFGFYAAGQFLLIAAVLCALRRSWLLTGLVAGLGLWTSPSALYVLVPAFLWLLPDLGRDRGRWARLAAGTAVGAAPLLGWLAVHLTLPIPPEPAEASTVPQRLANLAEPVFRQYAGVTYAHAEGGPWLPLQILAVLALAGAYVLAVVRRLRAGGPRRPADLLLMVPPAVAVLYAASNSTWYTGTPRYLLVTYPLLAIGVAALVRRVVPAVAVVALTAVLCAGFFTGQPPSATREHDRVLAEVAERLAGEGQPFVYANYWTAMPLQYVAGDRLVVATLGGVSRFPRAQAAVDAAARPVFVGSGLDGSTARIRSALDRQQVPYRARQFDHVTVFDQLPGRVDLDL